MAISKYQAELMTKLPNSIPFPANLSGSPFAACIGDIEVIITLPGIKKVGDNFECVVPAETIVPWTKHYGAIRGLRPLGRVTQWDQKSGRALGFYARRLLITTKQKITEEQSKTLMHDIEDWNRKLCLWIQILCKIDLAARSIEVEQHHPDTEGVVSGGQHTKMLKCDHPIKMKLIANVRSALNKDTWEKALKLTSEGTEPPESHVLLHDARSLLNKKRFRRSVLDSATAAEIALTKLRDDALNSTEPKLGRLLQQRYRGLYGLVEFLNQIQQNVPDNISEAVRIPRDNAIHSGAEPTQDVAQTCLDKATEVVDGVFPL